MRILNICAYTWAIGGPARIIYDHTLEALKHGHQVDILSPMTPGDALYPVPEGAHVIACHRTTPLSDVYREFSLDMYRYLQKHMHDYDIVHIHGIWHFGNLAPFLLKNHVPKVVTIHGLLDQWAINHSKWKKDLVSLLYQKRILAKADLIHVNNTDEVADVTKYLRFKPKNLVTIPNGMKMNEFAELPATGTFRRRFNLSPTKKMVLFMGRLNSKKGLDLLLPAFANYLKSQNDALLILAGPDDGYKKEVESFIATTQLSQNIKLVGMLTDEVKKAALADADLFVLPSYSEGFSIAVLEAMSARVPALVSDRVGFGEYIREYDAGYLTPLSVEGVSAGLLEMLSNPKRSQTYAENAFTMVKSNFDISIVAKRMLDAYQQVLVSKS